MTDDVSWNLKTFNGCEGIAPGGWGGHSSKDLDSDPNH
jgi:hypothetical protein